MSKNALSDEVLDSISMASRQLLPHVLDAMAEGMAILDDELRILYINESGRRILDGYTRTDAYLGEKFLDYIAIEPSLTNSTPVVVKSVQTGVAYKGLIRKLRTGKILSMNVVPLQVDEQVQGVLISAQDITNVVVAEEELDLAFSLTLPNSKVEHKLKHTVEYQDEYDPETGKIRITGVIDDGGYRHIVNSLKLFASLASQGVTKIIGIDKDLMVQAIIFHDLGKAQPELQIGDVVDPKEVFENSKLHAFRGAEIAANYYQQPPDIVEIIRYHHHAEDELPKEFPWRLIPMFRLFQLIDGLSAAITRGGVKVEFSVHDNTVYVTEKNRRPQYNGRRSINLFTGERRRLG